MKFNKVLSTLALAVILSLLMLAIPATPALAAPSIDIDPITGPTGTVVGVTASGFTPASTYTVLFNTIPVTTGSTAADGTFTAIFTVPTSPRGLHSVTVTTDAPDTSNTVDFTVTPQITLSPSSSYVGDQVAVNGTGFAASSTVTIYFDTATVGTAPTDISGSFANATFAVPESYRGSHTVKGSDATVDSPNVIFTTLSKITLTPPSGSIGDIVTISGTGFAPNSNITFYFDTAIIGAGATTTNTTGSFTNNTFSIPATTRGSHIIKAKDASDFSANATFTVGVKITISPTTGAYGTTVTVAGTGFDPTIPITIKYNGVPVPTDPAAVSTDAYGSFSASFSVPDSNTGTYPVEASDGTYSATADFTVETAGNLNPTSGNVGTEITAGGSGFAPNGTVTITYDDIQIATGSITDTGYFLVTFPAPPSVAGNHTITATDGTSTTTYTFTMESTPPPAPPPLLPLPDDTAKSKAYFDWADVDDPSQPLTYILQIASDAGFTTIVLDKTGLTVSEYTLTAEEKLEPTTEEAPYYWRAKAIDAASNASDWSTPRTFHVGAGVDLTDWVLYAVIGAGYLVLFFLCFWISRRGAHY